MISNVIKAANPVLHFMLQYQKKSQGDDGNPALLHGTQPPEDLLTHYKLLVHFLATVPTKEKHVRFWLRHYERQLEGQIGSYSQAKLAELKKASKLVPDEELSPDASIRRMPLTSLYSKIRKARDILQDLADRVQGAVCIVFWESWDATYQQLAEIVGDSTMEATENGRIFRPSGTAAIYINRRKVEKRAMLHRQQRLLMNEKASAEQAAAEGAAAAAERKYSSGSQDSLHPSITKEQQEKMRGEQPPASLLTPPEGMDTSDLFIAHHEDPSLKMQSPLSVQSPELRNERVEDEEIQALVDMYEKRKHSAAGNDGALDDEDGGPESWPFKLLSAPMNEQGGPLPLIDSSELDGIMDSNDAADKSGSSNNSSSADLRSSMKRKASLQQSSLFNKGNDNSRSSVMEHTDLRKRIRLMEDDEQLHQQQQQQQAPQQQQTQQQQQQQKRQDKNSSMQNMNESLARHGGDPNMLFQDHEHGQAGGDPSSWAQQNSDMPSFSPAANSIVW